MKKILKKVLDEIQKPEPNLSYIRGLLEAIVEEESIIKPSLNPIFATPAVMNTNFLSPVSPDPDMPPLPKSLQK